MKKTAYCLGINNYDASGAYGKGSNLNGCIEDTKTMKSMAIKAGFDVITLEDAQRTIGRVKKIYEEFARDSEPGDLILFAFSGHGTFQDIKGERKTGICLYDGVLWDCDSRVLLANIRPNRGVIYIADSCYSQDNWKGSMAFNGNNRVKAKYLSTEKISLDGTKQEYHIKYAAGLKIQANVIAITSSTLKQPSYDLGSKGGHFTISLAKAVDTRTASVNYFDIFNKTARIMGESDLPQNPIFATINGNVWKWTYREWLY